MIDSILRYTLPAAYDILPTAMGSIDATALLLTIGLQESRFLERKQIGGPARGFWQFERAGVEAVLSHPSSAPHIVAAMRQLRYTHAFPPEYLTAALEHNDVLAACFARCLLWTSPRALPKFDQPDKGWLIYVKTWRPGKPHENTWNGLWSEAWERTTNIGRPQAEMRKA